MTLPPVAYLRPATVEAAVAALAADEDARLLAGGQTLMATIATGLFRPSAMVSLAGIAELARDATAARAAQSAGNPWAQDTKR